MTTDSEPRTWIDVSPALTQRAGIARYVRGITEALVTLDPSTLGTYSHSWTTPGVQPFGVPHTGSRTSARAWRMNLMIGHLLNRTILPGVNRFDHFLATDLAFPFASESRVVVTVHDLTAVTHSGTHTPLTKVYTRFMLARLRKSQHRIIAVSHRTARDLSNHAGIDPRRVTVIHPGVAEVFFQSPDRRQSRIVLDRYGLTQPFALTVGTLEPRKNLGLLISAFEEIAKPSETLVIVGGKGWGDEATLETQYRHSSQVRVLGFIPDSDLACLYQSCQVFLMPSLYEGFGSPIAEALACEASVICSDQCGAVELAEGEVTLVDPLVKAQISDSMRQHLDATRPTSPKSRPRVRSYGATALHIATSFPDIFGGSNNL